jgi:hypothetical protein
MNWKEFTMKYGGGLTKYQKKGEFNWKTYKDVGIQPLPSKSQIAAAQGQQREYNNVPIQRTPTEEKIIKQKQLEELKRKTVGTIRATTDADIEAQNRQDYTLLGKAQSLGRGDFNPLTVIAGYADLLNPASYWYAGKDFKRGVKQTAEGVYNLDPDQIESGLLQTGLSGLQLYPAASAGRSFIKGAIPKVLGSTMSSQFDDFLRSVRDMDDFATGSPPVYRTQPALSSGPVSSTPAISRVGNTNPRSANFSKNLDDLKYANKFARTYGYSLPSDLERVAQSDLLTDRTIRGMMNRHNTVVRGVSTNYDHLPTTVIENLKKRGFDIKNDPEAAAIYMATTIPPSTGYGRVGIPQEFIDQGNEALYSSNSLGTAEGYTYGDGYIVTGRRPTDFSSSSRLDWIRQNNPKYYDQIPSTKFIIDSYETYYNPVDNLMMYGVEGGYFPESIGRDPLPMSSYTTGEEYKQASIGRLQNALNEVIKKGSDKTKQYEGALKEAINNLNKQNWELVKPTFDPDINIYRGAGSTSTYGDILKDRNLADASSLLQTIPGNLIKNSDRAKYHASMLQKIKEGLRNSENKTVDQITNQLHATYNPNYSVFTGDDYFDLLDIPRVYQTSPLKAYERYDVTKYKDAEKLRKKVLSDLKTTAFKTKADYVTNKILPVMTKTWGENKKIAYDQLRKKINEIENQTWEKPDFSSINADDLKSQIDNLYKDIVNQKAKYLDQNFPGWRNEKDRYAHYVFLGKPGEQVLEPISTKRITPEIYKSRSRAHHGDYTPGLSALSLIPAGLSIGAIQQYLENQRQKPKGTYQYGGPTIDLKLPQFEEDKPRPFFEMSGAGTGPQYDMFGYGYIPLGKNLGISADLMRWKEGDWRGGRYGISGNINIPINRGERRTRPDMKDPVMYQYGGASRADTLNLLANTRAVRNYYTGRDYTPDVNYTGRNLVSPSTSMYKNIWEALKADRSGFIATNAAYGIVTPSGQRKLSMSDYYRPIDRNKFYQREDQNLILDTRAPMQLYDKRIEPTGVLGYTNIKPSDPMSSDIIHFYTYDPISITPWDMLSTKQKKQRINKYGVSGTPYESKQDFIEKTSDQEVIRKQKLLKEAGLYKGEIDGDWGTGSEKAWKKYMELNTIPTTTNTSNTISETQVIPSTPRFNIQGIIADQYVPDAKDQTSREYRYRINTDKGFDVIKSKKDFEEWKQRNAAEYQPYYQRSTNAPIDYNKGRIQEYLETPTLMYTGDGTRRSGGESSYQYGGGFLPTRYTSNPYDPAIKNFNDSLNLYKGYVMQDYLMGPKNERISPGTRISWTPAELKKDRTKKWNPVLKQKIADDFQNQEEMFASDFVNENNKKLVRYYKSLGFTDDNIMYHTSADLVHPTIRAIGTYMDGSALSPIYKKPVQPVKYADPKVVEKQKILKDAGLYTGELDGVWGSGSKKAWEEYTKRNTTPRSLDGMTEVTYPTSTMIETTKLDPNGNPVTEIHYYDDLRTRERKDPKVQKYLVQTYNQMSTPYKKAAVAKYGDPSKVPFQGVNIYELNPNPYMKEEGGETNLFNWNNLDQWFKNGGESDFVNNIYSDYMDGVYDGTPLEENAKKVYDKLNTIYYRQAKESGMTPPNYIMTNVIKKALKPS